MHAVLNHASSTHISNAVHGAIEEELCDIRNRLVSIASKRRMSIVDIIQLGVVFTREELLAAASSSSAAVLPAAEAMTRSPLGSSAARSRHDQTHTTTPSGVGDASQATTSNSHGSDHRRSASVIDELPPTSAGYAGRHRPLPAGGQLRPDLPPDADNAWLEDEERRQSIPAQVKREFASLRSGNNSYSSGANQQADNTAAQKKVTSWDLQTKRCFGVEMETTLSKRSDEFLLDNAVKAIRDVVPTLRTFLGPLYEVVFADYQTAKDDRAYLAWKITTDLSIKSEDGRPIFGLEFITPKLSGPHDLWRVEHFCEQLQAMSFNVNSTTALHVHISAEDLTNRQLVRVCQYSVVFEHIFDSFVTLPRRSDYSRYCRSNLKSMSISRDVAESVGLLDQLNVDKSCASLIRLFCPRLSAVRNSHRNHKINLLLLNRTQVGTPGRRLEFRQHQGSVDKVEVGAWVTLLSKWVEKTSQMGRPLPTEGTIQRFWEIIDDNKLRAYYTVKAQTLPSSMTFTYDSRELYAYESDEEEASDIGGDTPPATPLGTSSVPPVAGGAAGTSFLVRAEGPSATASPPTAVRNPPAPAVFTPSPPSAEAPMRDNNGRVVPYHGRGDAFADHLPTSANPEGARPRSTAAPTRNASPPSSTSPASVPSSRQAAVQRANSSDGDASRSASGDDTALMARLGIPKWDAHDDASVASSCGQEPVIQTMRQQIRRQRGSISVGNFVLPLPLQAESLVEVHDDESWDQIVNTEPEIICTEREDQNDNTSWFITAPEGRVGSFRAQKKRSGRMDGAVRWISPWLLEAKKLEQMSLIHDLIRESLLMDESSMVSVVSVNVSGLSNAEICRIVVLVMICEQPLAALLNDSKQLTSSSSSAADGFPTKDFKVFGKLVAEILKLGSSSSGGTPQGTASSHHPPFPRCISGIVEKVMTASSFFDMSDVLDTTQPSRGNFNLRRSLRFLVRCKSVGDLASRCMFLSYMCSHIGKKALDADLVHTSETLKAPSRQDLLEMVSTLPTSVQRMLL